MKDSLFELLVTGIKAHSDILGSCGGNTTSAEYLRHAQELATLIGEIPHCGTSGDIDSLRGRMDRVVTACRRAVGG